MTYYVASSVLNAERVNRVAGTLDRLGHERTYDWTRHGSVADTPAERKRTVAEAEFSAVSRAELAVFLLPGRFGTHVELGAAIASNETKQVLLWSDSSVAFDGGDGFCVFYHHPKVERIVCPFETFLAALERRFAK